MKKLTFLMVIVIAAFVVSCKKDAQPVPDAATIIASQKALVTSNNWSVAFFTENNIVRTNDFSTFSFQFDSNLSGIAKITIDGTQFSGSWNLTQGNHTRPDDSGHHSGTEDNKFVMAFSGHVLLNEISEDWTIIKLTDTEMWLIDDNVSSPKEIHFVKN